MMPRSVCPGLAVIALGICIFLASSISCDTLDRRAPPTPGPPDPLEFYSAQSVYTEPGRFAHLYDEIPSDIEEIVGVVQGVLVSINRVEDDLLPIPAKQIRNGIHSETVEDMLEQIVKLDDRPLVDHRYQTLRMVGICTHFAMLTCSFLRHHGIPSRIRSGFETFVSPTAHHDHVICEYWSADESRWVRVDSEVDDRMVSGFAIEFNPLDLPAEAFIDGANAWKLCRDGHATPREYGIIGDEWYGGWDFVLSGLVHDYLALNKIEMLPWKDNRLLNGGFDRLEEDEIALLDRVSSLARAGNGSNHDLRLLYTANRSLQK